MTPCLFNIKFKVKLIQYGHIFFCFASENLCSGLMSRKGAELSTQTKINYYSVGIHEKQSETVKNVQHSKNDYHERSKQVPKNWHSGNFDAKWQERSFTNRDRNAFKPLVKSNRRLTVQDITLKLNECKTKTFSQRTMQRVLHSEGYKRRLAKKKMVVRKANRKKRVKWCKE